MNYYICPHTHLLHSGRCACRYATKYCVAEKEFAACLNKQASTDCINLYQALREQSGFAIDAVGEKDLPTAKQNKIKMGGLLALQKIIFADDSNNIADINYLVSHTKYKYPNFNYLPFAKLMPSIHNFKFRQPKKLK